MLWNLLHQLYARGFYKRLFINVNFFSKEICNHLTTLSHALEILSMRHCEKIDTLVNFTNLKELIVNRCNFTDTEILATNLVKLESLFINEATIEIILPFIRQLPTLKKIKLFFKGEHKHKKEYCYHSDDDVEDIHYNRTSEDEEETTRKPKIRKSSKTDAKNYEQNYSEWNVLDLVALNKEREKLRKKFPGT